MNAVSSMIDGINVGPQYVAADAELALDGQDVLGGQRQFMLEPIADGRLTLADDAPECRLRTGLADGGSERRARLFVDRHTDCTNGVPLGVQPVKRLTLKKRGPYVVNRFGQSLVDCRVHFVEQGDDYAEEHNWR